MRVIGGKAKGHGLKSLRISGVRPTSDMVRGAIFSMLECVAADWSRVLDLYAGTGALGIEALSRGAGRADFVERSPRLCAVIKENLKLTGFTGQGTVYCMSVDRALSVLKEEYGILLLDPPYADPAIPLVVKRLASSHLVGKESTLVVEHSRRLQLNDRFGDFRHIKELRHGDSRISVYQYSEGEN